MARLGKGCYYTKLSIGEMWSLEEQGKVTHKHILMDNVSQKKYIP